MKKEGAQAYLYGRELLKEELEREIESGLEEVLQAAHTQKGLQNRNGSLQCVRCGSRREDHYPIPCSCGKGCRYCLRCLQMGRIKTCSLLYHLPEPNHFPPVGQPVLTWKGTLSEQQAMASQDIIDTMETNGTRLVWAVAGAGKTEMLFEGIARSLEQGKRVAVASPRIDVCLELAPRLQAAFKGVDVAVLYGEMEEAYRYTPLVVATTHQLLRFKEAFDVLIIDEIDAFPFDTEPELHFAAEKARKRQSALIYLTATPDRHLRKLVKRKRLDATILPARYHGHPLPVPKMIWAGDWRKTMLKKTTQAVPVRHMARLLSSGRRFLVFVPNIDWMKQLEQSLREVFPDNRFASVSSKDAMRKQKVTAMRQEEVDFLLTTTILERGVTFRDIDVLVVGAEDPIFTEPALVQISGRVGRHPAHPSGEILFFHYGKSAAMKKAVKQIKTMNRLARERGLIHL